MTAAAAVEASPRPRRGHGCGCGRMDALSFNALQDVGDAELAKAIAEGLSEQALSVVTEELAMKRGSPRSFEGTRTVSQESQ